MAPTKARLVGANLLRGVGAAACLATMVKGFTQYSEFRLFPDRLFWAWVAMAALALGSIALALCLSKKATPPHLILLGALGCYIATQLITSGINPGSWLSPSCAAVATTLSIGLLCGAILPTGRWSAWLAASIAVVQGATILWSRFGGGEVIHSGSLRREMGMYTHPVQLITMLVVLVPHLAFPVLEARSKAEARLFGTLLCVGVVCGLATGYRLAAVALVLPSIVLLKEKWGWTWPKLALPLACLVALSLGMRYSGNDEAISTRRSTSGRMSLARQAFAQFLSHPLSGVGVSGLEMTASGTDPRSSAFVRERDKGIYRSPNNQYLQLMGEMGVFGALWLCAVSLCFARLNAPKTTQAKVRLASGAGLLFLGLTETPIGLSINLPGNVVFGYLMGQTLCAALWLSSPIASRPAGGPRSDPAAA